MLKIKFEIDSRVIIQEGEIQSTPAAAADEKKQV